ncbi:hypothetical protein ACGFWG_21385 [Streptomyces sp. NPDC048405]|uniref:hypothetical protein n=1 Tax=unclassified Streptomyces TaxID=2593676 RepID=UPI0013EB6651
MFRPLRSTTVRALTTVRVRAGALPGAARSPHGVPLGLLIGVPLGLLTGLPLGLLIGC